MLTALAGCPGDVTTATGGGRNTDPRRCDHNATPAWSGDGLDMTVSKPPCPFVIRDKLFSSLTYAAQITAPSSQITFDNGGVRSYVNAYALNYFDASTIASSAFNYFQVSPNDQTIYVSQVSMSGSPGTYLDPSDPTQTKMLDSLDAMAQFMAGNGIAEGWKILPGNIDPNAQQLLGPRGVATGQSATWRSYPSWDTTAYSYKWVVDGQLISSAADAQYATSLATGLHTLSNVTIRADNSRDSITMNVKAFNVSISGPTNVRPMATCSWSGSASGGAAPYSYSWSAIGASGTGPFFDYTNDAVDGSSFTVQLTVTDAEGYPVTVSQAVSVHSNAPICNS